MQTNEADIERQFLGTTRPDPEPGEVAALAYWRGQESDPRHETFHDLAKMAARVRELAQQPDVRGVYCALGVFADPRGARLSRKAENATRLGAIVLDMDCDPDPKPADEGKKYPTLQTAVAAAEEILPRVLRIRLRDCVIVLLGNGVHIYIVLSRPLPREEWELLAKRVKAALLDAGLLLDKAVTADAARVMRMPGTYNRKDPANRKLCRIFRAKPVPVDPDELAESLPAPVVAPSASKRRGINAEVLAADLPETPENVARVRSALAAIPPDVEYPVWRDVVFGVLSTGWSCAESLAREWSMSSGAR